MDQKLNHDLSSLSRDPDSDNEPQMQIKNKYSSQKKPKSGGKSSALES